MISDLLRNKFVTTLKFVFGENQSSDLRKIKSSESSTFEFNNNNLDVLGFFIYKFFHLFDSLHLIYNLKNLRLQFEHFNLVRISVRE